MRDSSQALRATAVEVLFAQICCAEPAEARDLAMLLTSSERTDMALFCYARTHTRKQGRAVAAACTRADLVRAGGQAGGALYDGAGAGSDDWGTGGVLAKKRVSLAG